MMVAPTFKMHPAQFFFTGEQWAGFMGSTTSSYPRASRLVLIHLRFQMLGCVLCRDEDSFLRGIHCCTTSYKVVEVLVNAVILHVP